MYVVRELSFKIWRFTRSAFRPYSKLVSCPEMAPLNEFSLNHYDVIGFDLDHTLCRYNLQALFSLIYDSLAQYLVEQCNYPRFLLQKNALDHHWGQKGIILDKAKGNFLKLDRNCVITKAYHGTHIMPRKDITEAYGSQCIWDEGKNIPYKTCSDRYLEEPFYVFKDFFTTIGAVLCAKLVDYLDEKNNGPLPVYSFFEHYLNALYYIYDRDNFKNNTGFYYPALKDNPHFYIEKCSPKLRQWLCKLHEHKKTFLLTSSNCDIARFLAERCIGPDWADYFDVIVTYAKKPGFFTSTCSFFAVEDDVEKHSISFQQMQPSKIYSQGNWYDLNRFLSKLSGIETPKVVYVGDSLLEDVYAPSQFVGWDTIAILEEMLAEGNDIEPSEYRHLLLSDTWGSFFSTQASDLTNQTLWASVISEHCKIAVPSLEALSNLDLREKIPSFSVSSPFAGYFPFVPPVCKKHL